MRGRLRQEISALNPGYGAWVMATGIVSTGFALFGRKALSDVLLVVACAAYALLLVAYAWRLAALWAFGTWWIPLLLGFVIWRHAFSREHLRYDAAWWSMVFPLGMYAAASANYGRATGLGFMVDIARGELWLGFAAWLGVFAAIAGSFLPARARARPFEGKPAGDVR